ncbi:MAG TPA: YHS domain-containing protein [Cellulomonas sp.]
MKRHLWFMVGGAALVLVVLLVAGVGVGQATRYALALACPLGMVAMMVVMGKGAGHGHGPADGGGTAMEHQHGTAAGQVDPVCGMRVDPAHAAATRERDGVRYFFCSTGCATAFDTEPARYLPV